LLTNPGGYLQSSAQGPAQRLMGIREFA